MQNRRNYQRELEQLVQKREQAGAPRPTLLLQACCAPCSSACLEYLRQHFAVTVLYYNPNITDNAEYQKRKEEEIRLIRTYNEQVQTGNFAGMHSDAGAALIQVMDCDHEAERFEEMAKGYETCPEGGERCVRCFSLRLGETARRAAKGGYDYFSTTLTISPLKSAETLNQIGEEMGARFGVAFLPSDFKKKNGYQRSIELSREFDLYRQDYCGCRFSKEEARRRRQAREAENQRTS